MKSFPRLAAAFGLALALVFGVTAAFAQTPAAKTQVKGYTKMTKTGKMVHVKGYSRMTKPVLPKMMHVKGYTKMTKTGKTVHVKGYSRTMTPKKPMMKKPGGTM